MRKLILIWVTALMHIEIYKYPAWYYNLSSVPVLMVLQFKAWYLIFVMNRCDVVEIETWCQAEGRIGTRRDWIIKDYNTGEVIGRVTR